MSKLGFAAAFILLMKHNYITANSEKTEVENFTSYGCHH
jgi:hypothetical protein